MNETEDGNGSTIRTPSAALGPRFVTTIVYVIQSPTPTWSGDALIVMLSLNGAVTVPVTEVESLSGLESVSPVLETLAPTTTSPLRVEERTTSTVAELPGDISPKEQTTSAPLTLQLPVLAVTDTTEAPAGRWRWRT